jgi:hypothetical protein
MTIDVTSPPFVTLTFGKIKEGRVEDYKRSAKLIANLVEEKEPRVIAFHAMLTEDGGRFAGVQVHRDAASMEFHLQVVREALTDIGSTLEIEEFKVLGLSSEAIDGMMKAMADSGIEVEHLPYHVGGFTRSTASD